MQKRTPESCVLKAITDLLTAERIPWFRMNSGAVKTEKRFFRFGEKGMADILAAPRWGGDPAFLWIEAKAAKGRQTEEQQSFENYVTEHGMNYIVARSSDDVLNWLKERR